MKTHTVTLQNLEIQAWGNSYIIRIPKAMVTQGMLKVGVKIPLIEIHQEVDEK